MGWPQFAAFIDLFGACSSPQVNPKGWTQGGEPKGDGFVRNWAKPWCRHRPRKPEFHKISQVCWLPKPKMLWAHLRISKHIWASSTWRNDEQSWKSWAAARRYAWLIFSGSTGTNFRCCRRPVERSLWTAIPKERYQLCKKSLVGLPACQMALEVAKASIRSSNKGMVSIASAQSSAL